jgi:uncharacterized membrane protein
LPQKVLCKKYCTIFLFLCLLARCKNELGIYPNTAFFSVVSPVANRSAKQLVRSRIFSFAIKPTLIMDAKTTAWVSYLTIVGWVIALVTHYNKNSKSSLATFHLRQSFGIFAIGFGLYFVFFTIFAIGFGLYFVFFTLIFIPFLSPLFSLIGLGLLILWVMGLIAALNGEEKPIPVVGPLFQQWFQFIQ